MNKALHIGSTESFYSPQFNQRSRKRGACRLVASRRVDNERRRTITLSGQARFRDHFSKSQIVSKRSSDPIRAQHARRPQLAPRREPLQAHRVLRQVVESSSLRSVGYDRATRTLEVEFKNGGVYQYEEVPPELWSELRLAESKGQFFQERVRDHFPTTRVS